MMNFLQLEGGYLLIGLFALGVAIFVGTRPFISNGQAWRKTVPFVLITMAGFISAHFFVTTARMSDVKERFTKGGAVICESKAVRKVAQSIIIDPKQTKGWILIGDEFAFNHTSILLSQATFVQSSNFTFKSDNDKVTGITFHLTFNNLQTCFNHLSKLPVISVIAVIIRFHKL